MEILIFGGTSEGRILAQTWLGGGLRVCLCVATDYGREVLPEMEGLEVRQGRMDSVQMRELAQSGYAAVVDATHPYAEQVSRQLRLAMEGLDLPFLRLRRREGRAGGAAVYHGADAREAARILQGLEGNILLTTGSKELSVFASTAGLLPRIYARVLPAAESLELCRQAGLEGRQIFAMQGPFTLEMNLALISQWKISVMVTKDGGEAGGFGQKCQAAAEAGIALVVIGRPDEAAEGCGRQPEPFYLEEAWPALERHLHLELQPAQVDLHILGLGPGGREWLPPASGRALEEADCVFGAPSLLERLDCACPKYGIYQPEAVLDALEERRRQAGPGGRVRAAAIYSGDVGFYSGGGVLARAVSGRPGYRARLYPGISSMAYLAAAAGLCWQGAGIRSLHGRGGVEGNRAAVAQDIACQSLSFFLLDGLEDARALGEFCLALGGELGIWMGYALGQPGERVWYASPQECMALDAPGLYCAFVQNSSPKRRILSPALRDGDFQRGKAPMTKEEIRHLALCKLGLWPGSVFYDIGGGTGSVALEAARLDASIEVYSLERKPEALALMEENRRALGLENVRIVEGLAPQAMEGLPTPSHVFVGGSGGYLLEICHSVWEKNPLARVAVTAISLETIGEINQLAGEFAPSQVEICQIQASRLRRVGKYGMLYGENPVVLALFAPGGIE